MKHLKLHLLIAVSFLLLAACATPEAPSMLPVSAVLPPLPDGVFDVKQVSVEPVAIRRVSADYPYNLRSRGISGEVVLAFVVGVDGKVRDVLVISATNEEFGKSAANPIRQWSFTPAQLNGAVVACRISSLRITFDT
jgi:TonB family protein